MVVERFPRVVARFGAGDLRGARRVQALTLLRREPPSGRLPGRILRMRRDPTGPVRWPRSDESDTESRRERGRSVLVVSRSVCVIEYEHTFAFPVAAERVWATMERFDCFCLWWPWLRDFSVEGIGLESGTVLHGVVVPPLPYRMRVDVVVNECVPRVLLARLFMAISRERRGSAWWRMTRRRVCVRCGRSR